MAADKEALQWPVASVERLRELGLDEARFGSCAEMVHEGSNIGGITIVKGCPWARPRKDGFPACQWRNNTKYMKPQNKGDVHPRPRNLAVRHVKPSGDGLTDAVIDSYCSCFQWHQDLKRRHKHNGELAAVIGGEGSEVDIRAGKKVVKADGSIYFDVEYKTVAVPAFPDPTENPAMSQAVFAAKKKALIEQDEQAMESADDMRRLGLKPEPEEKEPAGVQFVEVSPDDAKAFAERPRFGKGSRSGVG